jgi:hypothetical protein
MNTILIQAFDQDLVCLHKALVSSEFEPQDIVAYFDAKLGQANWAFYSAPELEAAE